MDWPSAYERTTSRDSGEQSGAERRILSTILAEMDGFEGNNGVIVLGATNQPEALDPALLRPGRFDRQVSVGLPDLRGRTAILQVHAGAVKLDAR